MSTEVAAAAAPSSATASPADAYLSVAGIAKAYGGQTVIEALDFHVRRGELVSLLGPSGCGKTTLLRLIAGLVAADQGSITLGGRELAHVPAHKRNVSVVFQNYALFPHLNVQDNVAFGLRARGQPAAGIAPAVAEALALVRMSDYALRPVGQLSGGQQQRVAVARALVVGPDLLLLDEPFSALDRKLRETMQIELKALLRSRGMTAIFVTHDQDEALAVSDRIAVMNAGRIEHFTDPATLYARPATAFALEFVGLSTRLAGTVRQCEASVAIIDTACGTVTARADFRPGSAVVIGVRPERIRVAAPDQPVPEGHNVVRAPLTDVVPLGARTHLYGRAAAGQADATADSDRLLCERANTDAGHGAPLAQEGQTMAWHWPVADTLVYPAPVS
jgi:putative spermidine/putrescine transport system ATP-binding protein